MKKNLARWSVVPVSLVFVLLAAGVPAAPATQRPEQMPALEFLASDVAIVRPGGLRQTMSLTGPVRPIAQAQVKTPMAGMVREVLVREGSAVKTGQVLVRMDDSEYQAQITQARGALTVALGQRDIARKARVHSRALASEGYISEGAADNAITPLNIAQANVDSAQTALDLARRALDDTIIRAPISGLVNKPLVQAGDRIPIDSRLFDIIDLSKVELEAAVSSTEIQKVTVGQEATLSLQGVANRLTGKVARINPATQSGTPNVMVYVEIDNPRNLLRAGMFAQADLTLLSMLNVMTVPQTAIQLDGDSASVYTVEKGVLARKPVTLGARGQDGSNDVVEVRAGLNRGAMVVRNNLGGLASGIRVKFAPGQTPVRPTPAATMTSAPGTAPTLTSGITAAPPAAAAPAATAASPLTSAIVAAPTAPASASTSPARAATPATAAAAPAAQPASQASRTPAPAAATPAQ